MSILSFESGTSKVKVNGRLGSRKSKTGCLTCKVRKVKCDESKPACKRFRSLRTTTINALIRGRCINAGRTCQGYLDVFVSNQSSITLDKSHRRANNVLGLHLRTPSRSPSPVPQESRALEYYQYRIANDLGASVDSDFWTRYILQFSEAEPAVRQGLVAISNLWELQFDHRLSDVDEIIDRHAPAYNKALAVAAQRVSEPDADNVALATCVLFMCLHCLRGDVLQARALLQTGFGVMTKVLRAMREPDGSPRNETAEIFVPIFERLVLLLRLFGTRTPHLRPSEMVLDGDLKMFSRFDTLDQARSTLYWLVSESHELIAQTRDYRLSPAASGVDELTLQDFQSRQATQLHAFATWLQAFESLCESMGARRDRFELYIAHLRLVHTVVYVWASTCLDQDESIFDQYLNSFKIIVHSAETLITKGRHRTTPFTFEMGPIPPLFLTVLKCRDPDLRFQALDLMRQSPDREGLWNREEAYRVAARVAELETNGGTVLVPMVRVAIDCDFSPEPSSLMPIEFKNARICDARTRATDAKGTHVMFVAKQADCQDIWHEWEEPLPLDDSMDQNTRMLQQLSSYAGIA